jgi:hypothetical protein
MAILEIESLASGYKLERLRLKVSVIAVGQFFTTDQAMARTVQVIVVGWMFNIVIEVVVLKAPGTHVEKRAFLSQPRLDAVDLLWRNENFAQYNFGQSDDRAD